MNDYDNIDYCLNILYDFVYGGSQECYELKYDSKEDIEMINIKKQSNFDHEQIFNSDISFIGENKGRGLFMRKSNNGYPSLLRIGAYSGNNSDDQQCPEMGGLICHGIGQ